MVEKRRNTHELAAPGYLARSTRGILYLERIPCISIPGLP
jgi:Mg-chelatase subunit ChlI